MNPSSNPPLALRLTGVDKSFGSGESYTPVLRKTDFEARKGELLLLVGPSGCGKTTLLSVLTGTLHAEGGEIEVLGARLDKLNEGQRTAFRSHNLGFIFQQFNLINSITVAENVAVPLLIQGLGYREAEARARRILERVGIGNKWRERPNKLSGGQQQRVAIARALVHEPPLIVCDEPTSALDRENGNHVMELLRDIARDGNRTVVVVTHDPRIYHFGDRMAEMEDGRIFRTLNSTKEIISAYGHN